MLEYFQSLQPQVLAAWVGGGFAILAAIVTGTIAYRIHRDKQRQDLDVAKLQEVRKHLEKAHQLLARVRVSFSRLAQMAPTLDEDGMLHETTNTLDVYAEYTRHLNSPNSIHYPKEIATQIDRVRKELSRLFLDLRRGNDARARDEFAKLMADDMKLVSEAIEELLERIAGKVKVKE